MDTNYHSDPQHHDRLHINIHYKRSLYFVTEWYETENIVQRKNNFDSG